jgi:uncharacterized membrane protein YfcA
MTTAVVVSILVGTFFGGFVSGIAGFAFTLVALSFWVWQIDPKLLAPMGVFGSFVAQLLSLGAMRRNFEWKKLMPFLVGGVIGVPIGTTLLGVVNITMFRLFVGASLVVYSSYLLFFANGKPSAAGGRLADGVAGIVGGTMGGLAGIPGPAPTLWCTIRGWDKNTQRCIFQTFNVATEAFALVIYGANGTLTWPVAKVFAIMLPAILLPTLLGVWLYTRINAAYFRRIVLSLLLLSGMVLLGSTLFARH